jgi:phosphatidate cytidylyltransferase
VLRWRLISAAVILAVLFALLWIDYQQLLFDIPGAWLLPILLAVSVLGTEEVLSLLRAKGHRPLAWPVYLGSVLVPAAASLPIIVRLAGRSLASLPSVGAAGWPLVALEVCAVLVLIGEMARFDRPGTAIVDAALAIFTIIYIGLLISFWALLRLHDGNARGMAALFSMLLIVKMADTGAFAFGKSFGRHKMTPILSPGKTWEGAIGGVATACVTSWLFFCFAAPSIVGETYVPPSTLAALTYGAALALAGMVGDLAESLLKRDMERKDSSTWLRGLGGVLDIIDAPLVAGPVAWMFWTLGLMGPGP